MRKYIATALLFIFYSFSSVVAQDRSTEFREFEEIALWSLRFSNEYTFPNQRYIWIRQAERYEAFASKYPKSPLVAEAKLQAALIYRTIDVPEVGDLRIEAENCAARTSRKTYVEICEILLNLKIRGMEKDKFFLDKAHKMFLEIAEKFGHEKRYMKSDHRVGRFEFVDEDAGAYALMIIAENTDEKTRRSLFNIVLKHFKINDQFKTAIEHYLKND